MNQKHKVLIPSKIDYGLTGKNAFQAVEMGLAEADWYQCPVPRETLRCLLERRDGPALRDTLIWFGLIFASGYSTWLLWGSWWAIVPYAVYCVIYATTSDSRWHEAGHGTAFKTDWINNALYEIASFMVMRESTVWRWSHARHHSDTIIVGRDPEIAVPRPPNIWKILLGFFNLPYYPVYFKAILLHSLGRITMEEKSYIPESQFPRIYQVARISLTIYLAVLGLALFIHSILPLMFIGLPNIFGTWLMHVYGYTQHAGLAENVLDHRLNCRTVYMDPVNQFLYWNMNYHLEHHMFPLVPYYALPKLHDLIKEDCPAPYSGILAAWREIVPAVLRQVKNPAYFVKRELPPPQESREQAPMIAKVKPDNDGWIEVFSSLDLRAADVIRFDYGRKTFALFRDAEGKLYATDGICTHGNTHLAGGLVKDDIIECPKHNGRFHLVDGSPARAPICRGLATYPLEERQGRLYLNVFRAGGASVRPEKSFRFRVLSNCNVATFVKELILVPLEANENFEFTPGDYLQLDIPAYEVIRFRDFEICEPYVEIWERYHLFDLVAHHPGGSRRNNYSLGSNWPKDRFLRFNVRIATPPPGQDCLPGLGSSYVFSLKPGDVVTAVGPFGDFHIKPTQKEMIYMGGGAGMAPLRAHLTHLFETEKTARKVSFWYGARSKQELFYEDYFQNLASEHPNFHFYPALSSPLPEDEWAGLTGFIHEVLGQNYLNHHKNLRAVEYYLCGPPMMIRAGLKMLGDLGVPLGQIAYDEF